MPEALSHAGAVGSTGTALAWCPEPQLALCSWGCWPGDSHLVHQVCCPLTGMWSSHRAPFCSLTAGLGQWEHGAFHAAIAGSAKVPRCWMLSPS